MKKILFIALLSSIICGCSKDEPLTLNTESITLYPGEMYELTANAAATFRSENPFVATLVGESSIKAMHVGKTIIKVSSENGSKDCTVEVKSKINLYQDPVFAFGESQEYVKSKETRALVSSSSSSCIYRDTNPQRTVIYNFDNDRLSSIGVTNPLSEASKLGDFLSEKYQLIKIGEGDFAGYFVNGETDKWDVMAGVKVTASYILVTYIPR